MSDTTLSTLGSVPDQPDNLALRAVVDDKGYIALGRAIGGGGMIHTSVAHLIKLYDLIGEMISAEHTP